MEHTPAEDHHEGIDSDEQNSLRTIVMKLVVFNECPRGHPQRARACNDLAFSLWEHCNQFENQELLTKAIELNREVLSLCPPEDPDHAISCRNLAASLGLHYERTGDEQLLAEAIDLERKALALCPSGHPDYATSCRSLAVSLHLRYEHIGDQQLLAEIIDLERKALALCPQGHPYHALSCSNLAASLNLRYELTGDQQLLIEIIELQHKALALCPQDHPHHPRFCRNLAGSLCLRYEHSGNQQLLAQAIDLERKALALCPQGHPHHGLSCQSLAVSLHLHYQLTGDQQLLAESIDLKRKALALCPQGHTDLARSCQNLAVSLSLLFQHTGDPQLLAQAIDLERKVLDLCPQGHLHHEQSCHNLAVSLHLRYELTGDQQLLAECIDLKRKALALCPQGHLYHGLSCQNLAASLDSRYTLTGDQQLLAESIDLKRKALSLCPQGHPDHARSCQNLAVSLLYRYELTNDQRLLAEAINLKRSALALCPRGHLDHTFICRNLAASLCLRYKHTGNQQLLEEAIEIYKECSLCDGLSTKWRSLMGLANIHLTRGTTIYNMSKSIEHLLAALGSDVNDSIPAAVNWAISTLDRMWQCEALDHQLHASFGQIYQRLFVFLPLLAHPVFDPQEQLRALKRCSNVGPDAFIDATLTGSHKYGLEMIELMQGLIWSRRLHYQDPQLDDVPNDLANALKVSLESLDQSTLRSASDERVLRDVRHNASVHVQDLVRQIRNLPGLDRFMLGEAYADLCMASYQHPVVILIAARGYFYALIMHSSFKEPALLPLELKGDDLQGFSPFHDIRRSHRGFTTTGDIEPTASVSEARGVRKKANTSPCMLQLSFIWAKVVKPVLDCLGFQRCIGCDDSRPRVYWCPIGVFSTLPLHAAGIYEGPAHERPSCVDYVISSYIPTVTTLRRLQKASTSRLLRDMTSLALVAEERAYESQLPSIRGVVQESIDVAAVAQSARLQSVRRQVGSTSVLNVISILEEANIVHLACHGVQDSTNATQSGFYLGDGRLTIEKLMDIKLENAFLAYLSACQTATGDREQPDQAMHLAAAMLYSGFKSVVATMWAIDDDDGRKVATWFYEELFSNEVIDADSVPHALDVAVGKLRVSGAPLERWAPFIHMGL